MRGCRHRTSHCLPFHFRAFVHTISAKIRIFVAIVTSAMEAVCSRALRSSIPLNYTQQEVLYEHSSM